ncbi:MAG: site-specific DNA-methyltransferase, partial [Treponema sp.]|nr:site-specific DNA-methyltransferase [Treponema sp.]
VPYIEQKQYDIESIVNDIKRIKSAMNTEAGLNKILDFLHGGELYQYERGEEKYCITQQPGIKDPARFCTIMNSIKNGMREKSVIYCDVDNKRTGTVVRKDFPAKDRAACTIESIHCGMREKSVIELGNSHYGSVHPAEKPVRLAERIIAHISDTGDTIFDPFMGSGSFGAAALRMGRKYIGSEISQEYFKTALARIKETLSENSLCLI